MDLVSVIIPVYNAEKTLQRCVISVLKQHYKDIQLILIDDGSKDESSSICDKLAEIDNRIMVIHQENSGVSAARNRGIDIAIGKYIMFLDSDDFIKEDIISNYLGILDNESTDVIIGGLSGVSVKDGDSFIKKVPIFGKHSSDIWNVICNNSEMFGYIGGKIFRKDIINTYNIKFNTQMYAQEDLDFCLSYYEVIDQFYLTEYAGYQYYYEEAKRVPPYCDFMRNQLKLLRIAEEKCELTTKAYMQIQNRVCGYVYVMFYGPKKRKES